MNARTNELIEQSLGNKGSSAITGTTAVTGSFTALQAIDDTVVAAQTDATGATNADLTAFTTIPAGAILFGRWTSITLTSGEMIGYLE